MKIGLNDLEVKTLPNFKGGEGALITPMHTDELNKILTHATLEPGSTIGLHTHTDSSEIIYIIKGKGMAICDGVEEYLQAGDVHYCKKGSNHTLINNSDANLEFFAVVANQ